MWNFKTFWVLKAYAKIFDFFFFFFFFFYFYQKSFFGWNFWKLFLKSIRNDRNSRNIPNLLRVLKKIHFSKSGEAEHKLGPHFKKSIVLLYLRARHTKDSFHKSDYYLLKTIINIFRWNFQKSKKLENERQ